MTFSPSVQLKLDRARELKEEIRVASIEWAASNPYRFVTEQVELDDPVYSHLNYCADVSVPLPSTSMSKRLGDAIGNFRAVLDHVVWELSMQHSGPTPSNPRGIGFPRTLGAPGLHAVDPKVLGAVEAAFLSAVSEDLPDSPLTLLCDLSNVDKHVSIHAIYHYVREVEITTDPVVIGTNIEVVQGLTELRGLQIIARITIPRPLFVQDAIDVRCRTQHGVVIAPTDRTPVLHLGRTLEAIDTAVDLAASMLSLHLT